MKLFQEKKAKRNEGENKGSSAFYFLMCFTGLTFVLMNNWVMNTFMFPQYDAHFYWLREIASAAQGLTLVFIAVVATWRPSLLSKNGYRATMFVCLASGTALTLIGLFGGSLGILILGASLMAVGRGFVIVFVGLAFIQMPSRIIGIIVAASCVASYGIRGVFLLHMPAAAGEVLYFAIPFIAAFSVLGYGTPLLSEISHSESPAEMSLVQPSSFLPFGHQLFLCLLLFRITHGYALAFGMGNTDPASFALEEIPLCILLVYALRKKENINPDTVFQVSFLLIIAGYLLLPLWGKSVGLPVDSLLVSGVACFEILSWFVLISLGKKNRTGAISILAWGSAMTSFGIIIGANVEHLAYGYFGNEQTSFYLVVAAMVFLAVLYATVGLKKFSFTEIISDLKPMQSVVVKTDVSSLEKTCATIGADYGLTAREKEVFVLLARGRNGRFIQNELIVSYNTIRAHIKHIYVKLGVHTHQELIDFVEKYHE